MVGVRHFDAAHSKMSLVGKSAKSGSSSGLPSLVTRFGTFAPKRKIWFRHPKTIEFLELETHFDAAHSKMSLWGKNAKSGKDGRPTLWQKDVNSFVFEIN